MSKLKKKEISGLIAIIFAGSLWGSIGLFVNKLEFFGLDSLQIVAIRVIVTGITMTLIALCFDRKCLKCRVKDIWIFVCSGILSIIGFTYFYFSTIANTSMAVAAVLLYLSPVVVMTASLFLFREKLTLLKIAACGLAVIGCALVSGVFSVSHIPFKWIVTGLLSAIGYASYSILGKIAMKRGYSAMTITTYTFIFASIGSLFIADIPELSKCAISSPSIIWIGILMGIATCTIPYIAYTFGLSRTETGKAAITASIEPVIAAILGTFVMKEQIDIFGVIGIILVICAIIILNLKFSVKQKQKLSKF